MSFGPDEKREYLKSATEAKVAQDTRNARVSDVVIVQDDLAT